MLNSIYHVHIIKVAGEQPIADSQLALFFEKRAFLTYDLPALIPESAAYSRRCIDDCDCVLMMVGKDYGETNQSGVSQMHLSYLTARTKLKPILIFVQKLETTCSRRIIDFVNLIQLQNKQHLYYYQYERVLGQHLKNVYQDFEQTLTVKKWVRMDTTTPFSLKPVSMHQGNNHNSGIFDSSNNDLSYLDNLSSKLPTTRNPKAIVPTGSAAASSPATLDAANKNNGSETLLTQSIDQINAIAQSNNPSVSSDNPSVSSNRPTSAQQATHIDKITVNLTDELLINYHAHAYQDGNLSDVVLCSQLKWADLVSALTKFSSIFSTENMYRSLNEKLTNYATKAVKKTMPNVHAVSRCQICQMDFEWICSELLYNDWMTPVSHEKKEQSAVIGYNLNNKKYWQLTPQVKAHLKTLEVGLDESKQR